MLERDWAKDWEMAQEVRNGDWWRAGYTGKMLEALPYWLQRVRELEEENAKLRRVIEAAGISVNDAMIIEKHLSEMGEDAVWGK